MYSNKKGFISLIFMFLVFVTIVIVCIIFSTFYKIINYTKLQIWGNKSSNTVVSFSNDKYLINRYLDVLCLKMYYERNKTESETLIQGISDYKIENKKLYALSKEGYCVINEEDNKCRLYITLPKEKFIIGYNYTESGEVLVYRYIDADNITYLESFEDYTEEEQEILKKLKN